MKRFNVIVIGLGRIGMIYSFDRYRKHPASHVAAINENPHFRLVGASDIDSKKRILCEKKYHQFVFESYKKLFKDLKAKQINLDLVVISTPEKTHYNILKYCINELKNKKNRTLIFCEKPLTDNLRTAKIIKNHLKKTKIKVVVNHSRRWSYIWQMAYQFSKKLGKIEHVAFNFSTSPENKNFSQIRDGIHIADIISWYGIKSKTKVNRLFVPYFLYDFHLWAEGGKIEILNFGKELNLYKINKSKSFKGFKELKLEKIKKLDESYLVNAYDEFDRFLKDGHKLSSDIDDAIDAMQTFEKYVYDKKLPR